MLQLKALIIDDEPLARGIIESYISQLGNWNKPVSVNNALEAMETLKKGYRPDVIFLDVNMPVINGIEFFRMLNKPPAVILTTASRDFAVEAFDLHAVDYLVKPISFQRFLKAVQRVYESHFPENEISQQKPAARDFIFLKHNGKMQRVNFADILYIEAKGDYVNIYMANQNMLISMQLKEIEECLPVDTYIRVHRSFIVNLNAVETVFGNTITIGKKEIPIGLNHKENFLKLINDKKTGDTG